MAVDLYMDNQSRDLPVHEVLYGAVTLLLAIWVRPLKGVIVNVNVIVKVNDVLNNGCPIFYGKGPSSSWAGLRAARVKITKSATPPS